MKKFTAVLMIMVLMLALVGCNSQQAPSGEPNENQPEAKKLKVALLLPGTINDGGWSSIAYEGLKAIEKELGAEISYAESVPTSDYEERFRAYANDGYNIIIGHGFEFGDPGLKVAKDFPDITFIITSSTISQEPNVGSLQTATAEAGYIAGAVAGLNTKSNKIFAIGGLQIPPIVQNLEAFKRGAMAVNPNAQVDITYTLNHDDAAKAKELAKAFIEKGYDLGTFNCGQAGLGVLEIVQQTGKAKIAGVVSNYNDMAPDHVLASSAFSFPNAMLFVTKQIVDDEFTPQFYNIGVADGGVLYYPNDKLLDEATKAKVDEIIKSISEGKLDVSK